MQLPLKARHLHPVARALGGVRHRGEPELRQEALGLGGGGRTERGAARQGPSQATAARGGFKRRVLKRGASNPKRLPGGSNTEEQLAKP